MKRVIRIAGYTIAAILIIAILFLAYLRFSPLPDYEPGEIPVMTVDVTPERVAEGHRISAMLCQGCHFNPDTRKMDGKRMVDVPEFFGKFYSANITQDPEHGIGKWTDGELYYYLRTGIRKDGHFSGVMPNFPKIADETVLSLIAYLHSDLPEVQPSTAPSQTCEYAMLGRFLKHFVIKPKPYPSSPIPLPDTTQTVAWGNYLANDLYACYGCHSGSFSTNDDNNPPNSNMYYAGGNQLLDLEGKTIYSVNITPDTETGIGNWTPDQFRKLLKYGLRPDGTPVSYPMIPHSGLSNGEIDAIFAFLKTVPPVHNEKFHAGMTHR
ncbi:MAG: hypothetical protein KDC57_20055 [Saprospiraceae bacterium]|nr:hypothetical protein [Saprospiraceae bacterium]